MAGAEFTRYEKRIDAEQILSGNLAQIPTETVIVGSLILRGSSVEEIPPNLDILGDLDLSGSRVKKLGGDLRIFGDLRVSNSEVKSLSSGLFIEGNLILKDSLLTELPVELTVYGEIDLAESRVDKLSPYLTVRCLTLANTLIVELPKHLTVKSASHLPRAKQKPSFLDLKGSKITHIPDYSDISNLDLQGTQIATYGKKVEIGHLTLGKNKFKEDFEHDGPAEPERGHIKLKNSKRLPPSYAITVYTVIIDQDDIPVADALALKPQRAIVIDKCSPDIPSETQFHCSLELLNSSLEYLPDDLIIGSYLIIRDTPLVCLPASIQVKQSLVMKGSKVICRFPKRLQVRDLELYGTSQTKLPDELFAAGYVVLRDTNIEALSLNLEVGMNLIIHDNRQSLQIPRNSVIKVGAGLYWRKAPFESWPENMLVCGGVYLAESEIRSLPDGFLVNGTLDLNNSKIEKLPENLTVLGDLQIENTAIASLPDSLIVTGRILADGTPLTQEECASMSFQDNPEPDFCTWSEMDKHGGTLNKYAYFDVYDGCEIIEGNHKRKLIRPFGQMKQIWIEPDANGNWRGEYPSFKPEYPEYGY